MKSLILILTFATSSAWAQANAFSLDDKAILGQYRLEKKNANSEIQTIDLVYNEDNVLVIRTDRNDTEYPLTGPDKNGIIVDYQDEPNCDGDEDHCWYDSQVTMSLGSTKNKKNETIPQVTIEITQTDAWVEDDSSDETTTYVLNWNKELPYAIPYYLYVEASPELKKIIAACNEALKDMGYDSETSLSDANDVCPYGTSYQYREPFDEALAYLFDSWGGKDAKDIVEMSKKDVKKKVFTPAKDLAGQYKADGPVKAQDIIEQLEILEAYVDKADVVYGHRNLRGYEIYVINTQTRWIERMQIQTTNKYEN